MKLVKKTLAFIVTFLMMFSNFLVNMPVVNAMTLSSPGGEDWSAISSMHIGSADNYFAKHDTSDLTHTVTASEKFTNTSETERSYISMGLPRIKYVIIKAADVFYLYTYNGTAWAQSDYYLMHDKSVADSTFKVTVSYSDNYPTVSVEKLTGNGVSHMIFGVEYIEGTFRIRKAFEGTADTTQNFMIHVFNSFGTEVKSFNLNAGQDWVTVGPLPKGSYTVTEDSVSLFQQVSIGYPGGSDSITINSSGANGDVTVTNRMVGSAIFSKAVDNVNNDSVSFKLNITSPNGYNNTVTVSETGAAVTLSNLPLGTYTVTEDAKTGYRNVRIDGSPFTITAENRSAAATVTAHNEKLFGSVKLAKVVSNVTGDTTNFKLNVTGDTGYSGSVTLNETSGWQTLGDLPFGHYTVTEDAKTGYKTIGITPPEFDIDDSTYTAAIEVTAENEKLYGSVSLEKVVDNAEGDSTDFTVNISSLNGFNHNITLSQSDGVVDSSDYAFLANLPFGTYTVEEINGTGGYDKVKLEVNGIVTDTFIIDNASYATTIAIVATNHKRLGAVSLQKIVDNVAGDTTDFTVNISNGAGFSRDITLSESDGVVDKDDYAFLASLPYGTYTVTETGVAGGYEKVKIEIDGEEASTFTIGDSSYTSTIAIVVTNRQRTGSITLRKIVDNAVGDSTDFTVNISSLNGYNHDVTLSQSDGLVGSADFAFLSELPYGTYTVAETGVAGGYEKVKIEIDGTETDTFTIDDTSYASTIAIAVTNHQRLGRVSLRKFIDNKTGDTTPFTINISNANGYNHDITLSQADGLVDGSDYAFLAALPYGIYTVSETGVATGYSKVDIKIDGTEISTFTIDDSTYEAEIAIAVTNTERHCAVQLLKVVDNATADSTAFTINISSLNGYNHDVTLSQSDGLVDGSDFAFLAELPYGTYTVAETGVGSGYEKVKMEIDGVVTDTFTIDDTNHESTVSITATNHKRLGAVSVQKVVDNASGDSTDFTVNISSLNGYNHDVTLSQSDGVVDGSDFAFLSELPYGTYKVTETGVAGGYEKVKIEIDGTTADTFTIDDTSYASAIAIVATNHQRLGQVNLLKVVDNATGDTKDFTINIKGDGYDHDVTLSQNDGLVTSADYAFLAALPYGTYTVTEKNIDSEYEKVKIEIDGALTDTLTINDSTWSATISIVATNHKRAGRAVFAKTVDNVDNDPAQFTLNIYKDGSATPYKTVTVNETGTAVALDLPFGHYTVQEVANPLYETVGINDDDFTIDAQTYTQPVYVTAVNHKKFGWVSLAKVVDNVEADPSEFTIVIEGVNEGNDYYNEVNLGELTTGGSSWNLPLGHYTVTEKAKDNYINISITPDAFDITDANYATTTEIMPSASVVITNRKLLSRIQLTKTDAANPGLYLAGAVFTVTDIDGVVKDTLTTDATGTATSIELEAGTYWVKETAAPAGYVIDNPAAVEVTLPYNVTLKMAPFTDTLDEGALLIHKVSTLDQKPVAGVQFQVSTRSDFAADSLLPLPNDGKTDAKGELLVQHLKTGLTLYVREIKQAPGYDIDPAVVRNVTVVFNKVVTADFANSPVGSVRVTKSDSADTTVKLAGAVFGIYSDEACTKLVQTLAATDANGVAVSQELPFGANTVYYVKEITAPAGYLLNSQVQQVKFTEPGQTVELAFTNTKTTGSLIILKVDALDTTKKLAGATFQLYADAALTTKVGAPVTTGADGLATWTNLAAGTYWVLETAAPTDYELPTVAIDVTVTAGMAAPEAFVITNQYNPPEDIQTGMMDWNVLLLGAIALLAGLMLVVFSRKRSAQRHGR